MAPKIAPENVKECDIRLGDHSNEDEQLREVALQSNGSYLETADITEAESDEAKRLAEKMERQNKKWNRRMRALFCCLGYKRNKDSISDVADLFARLYTGPEMTATEHAASFVLLGKYQEAQREWMVKNERFGIEKFLSGVPITSKTRFLDVTKPQDSHLINDLIYYMNYSLCIFGWPLYVMDSPGKICCCCPYMRWLSCCDSTGKRKRKSRKKALNQQPKVGELDEANDWPIVIGDNCCLCNYAVAHERIAKDDFEIIYINYRSSVNVTPFAVVADHSKRTIVVAIRGSMSLSDAITDMNGHPEKLPIEDCPDDWFAHRGILRAAVYVKETLQNNRLLEIAFNSRPDLNTQDYSLLLCGHSLGAGASAILGVLLRKSYPTLRAYLYSPPGGLLSLPVVEYTKEFATGVFVGIDCVPRMGFIQVQRLKYYIFLCLKSSQRSYAKVLAKAICPTLCCGDNQVDYDPDHSIDLLMGEKARAFEYKGKRVEFVSKSQMLFVPGRLIHVVRDYGEPGERRSKRNLTFRAIWVENVNYDRLFIGEGMFTDHLPFGLYKAMKSLFPKPKGDREQPDHVKADSASSTKPHFANFDATKHVALGANLGKKKGPTTNESNNSDGNNHDTDENNNPGKNSHDERHTGSHKRPKAHPNSKENHLKDDKESSK